MAKYRFIIPESVKGREYWLEVTADQYGMQVTYGPKGSPLAVNPKQNHELYVIDMARVLFTIDWAASKVHAYYEAPDGSEMFFSRRYEHASYYLPEIVEQEDTSPNPITAKDADDIMNDLEKAFPRPLAGGITS
ncbi:MAG: hypothetical protein HY365_00125 [Candidatus Aenigmarchaeota archaeon]|nr:hypothetical protein [Candidatus Aenigmarchaeota archaeon]